MGCIGENWYSYLRGRQAPEYGSVDIPMMSGNMNN